MTNTLIINEKIISQKVRLINETGQQVGIVDRNQALYQAKSAGLDLVLIAADANPPVAKILDAGKFIYESKKKEKEAARKQRESFVETKEIRMRPTTDDHDIEIKARKAKEFLEEGSKVRLTVRFKGREQNHKDIGVTVLQSLLDKLGENIKMERPIVDSGRDIFCIIMPGA